MLLFLLLEKIQTQNKRSTEKKKQRQTAEITIRTDEYAIKGLNMTSHGRYVGLHGNADSRALVEVPARNPLRNSQFLIQMLFRG
jgi:hypothetical protein